MGGFERRRPDGANAAKGNGEVNGRRDDSTAGRRSDRLWYVDHWSLRLDLRILLMTATQVLRRSSVAVTQDLDEVEFPLPPAAGGASQGHGPNQRDGDPFGTP